MSLLSENLRRLRRAKRLRQLDVARATGLSEIYISKIECERIVPTDETIDRLAEAVGVDRETLTSDTGVSAA